MSLVFDWWTTDELARAENQTRRVVIIGKDFAFDFSLTRMLVQLVASCSGSNVSRFALIYQHEQGWQQQKQRQPHLRTIKQSFEVYHRGAESALAAWWCRCQFVSRSSQTQSIPRRSIHCKSKWSRTSERTNERNGDASYEFNCVCVCRIRHAPFSRVGPPGT